MITTLEIQYDKNCVLSGDIKIADDTFTHEFGNKYGSHYEVGEFTVTVWIKGIDYNITKSLSDVDFDRLRNQFLKMAEAERLEAG